MADDPAPNTESSGSAREQLGAELRRVRKNAGLSQPQLARAVGYSRQYISSAENPQHPLPSAELVQAIDRHLGVNNTLVELRKAAQLEAYAIRNGLTGMVNVGGATPDGYVDGEEDDVKRRTLLGMIGQAAATSPLVSRLEEVRRGLDGMLLVEPTDRDVDDWEQAAATYATEVGIVHTERLLGELVADFEEIQRRIAEASGHVRTRLIHTGSQLAALTAISLVNLREPRPAERWWRTAARAAAQTGDPDLVALVSGRHAVFSLNVSPPARVLALADAAVARGRNTPSVGVISGLAARAQIFSEQGRQTEATTALRQVVDTFERLPPAALRSQHGQWNWAEQRLHHVESHVHAHAGRLDEAQTAHDAAVSCYPSSSYQGRTQVALHQAIAMIRSGDVSGGADQVVSVFNGLKPWQRADGLVLRTGEAALTTVPTEKREHPQVKAAQEMLHTTVNP